MFKGWQALGHLLCRKLDARQDTEEVPAMLAKRRLWEHGVLTFRNGEFSMAMNFNGEPLNPHLNDVHQRVPNQNLYTYPGKGLLRNGSGPKPPKCPDWASFSKVEGRAFQTCPLGPEEVEGPTRNEVTHSLPSCLGP